MFRVPGPQRRGAEAEVRIQVSQETELLTSGLLFDLSIAGCFQSLFFTNFFIHFFHSFNKHTGNLSGEERLEDF
jgi:hypothetical protein